MASGNMGDLRNNEKGASAEVRERSKASFESSGGLVDTVQLVPTRPHNNAEFRSRPPVGGGTENRPWNKEAQRCMEETMQMREGKFKA